jgi:hypothetical protein
MVPAAEDIVCLLALALTVVGAVARRRRSGRWAVWTLATGVAVLVLVAVPDFVRGFRDGWNDTHCRGAETSARPAAPNAPAGGRCS